MPVDKGSSVHHRRGTFLVLPGHSLSALLCICARQKYGLFLKNSLTINDKSPTEQTKNYVDAMQICILISLYQDDPLYDIHCQVFHPIPSFLAFLPRQTSTVLPALTSLAVR